MNSDEQSQIINELANIRKEIAKFRRGASLSVAFGIIGSSLIFGVIWVLFQMYLSTRVRF